MVGLFLSSGCSPERLTGSPENPSDSLVWQTEITTASDLIINEVCIRNSTLIKDEFGNDPDWIELYNRGDTAINLNGYALSDDSAQPMTWLLGDVVIEPSAYLLVFASDQDVSEIVPTFPDDSIHLDKISRYSDNAEPGGNSTIALNEYASLWPVDSAGYRILSATFDLVDNRPDLDWSAANFTTTIVRSQTALGNDYSKYANLDIVLTLAKGRSLGVRIVQSSFLAWKGPLFMLEGTGVPDDHYSIPLVQGKQGLDLTNVQGFCIQAAENLFVTTSFTLKRLTFTALSGNLHATFKLSGNEQGLLLSAPDTTLLHEVPLKPLPNDVTVGRCGNTWTILAQATPGAANVEEVYTGVVPVPELVTQGGFFSDTVSVVLSGAEGASIYYTLNGSLPDTFSERYNGPITITATTVLRYRLYSAGMLPSEVRTETYFIGEPRRLPVVSLVVDAGAMFDSDTGLYMKGPNAADSFPYFGANFWVDKELPAVIALYEKDGNCAFSVGAGVSLSGNWSRGMDKKSLAIDFRELYGTSELKYPLFPALPSVTTFKKIILRSSGGTYRRSFIEDAMMQSLLDDRDVDHQKSRPVVLYINGRYFGLHHLKEAANHDYVYSNYGLKKEEIDFFDAGMRMKWGTPDRWNNLTSQLAVYGQETGDTTMSDSEYAQVCTEVDIREFIDYNAHEIYINNTDWPANNCRFWRSQASNGMWRWLTYDLDAGFGGFGYEDGAGEVSFNTVAFALDGSQGLDTYPNGRVYTFLLRALMHSPRFKTEFINRFVTLLATDFSSKRVNARIDSAAAQIADEVSTDAKRWGYTVEEWQHDIDELKAFADARGTYVITHIATQFSLDATYVLTVGEYASSVWVNGIPLRGATFRGTYFTGIPLELTVEPLPGSPFVRWSDGSTDNPRTFDASTDTTLTPEFGG